MSGTTRSAALLPKPDGKAVQDQIVQRAVVEVLNAIYEEHFLGFSRGRSHQHPAELDS